MKHDLAGNPLQRKHPMIRSNSKNNNKKNLKTDCLKPTSFTLPVFIIKKEEHLFHLPIYQACAGKLLIPSPQCQGRWHHGHCTDKRFTEIITCPRLYS